MIEMGRVAGWSLEFVNGHKMDGWITTFTH